MWRLNNMLLNNKWVNNEMKEEIKKYLETNKNENRTIQHLWDTVKQSKEKNSYQYRPTSRNKKKHSQTNNINLYLKELEKEQQTKPKVSRIEIIKIRVHINKIESKNIKNNQ